MSLDSIKPVSRSIASLSDRSSLPPVSLAEGKKSGFPREIDFHSIFLSRQTPDPLGTGSPRVGRGAEDGVVY